MSIVREPDEYQTPYIQIRNSDEVSVTMRRQRLNRFRRMLITRSDDGYFGRNPQTRLMESSINLEEVRCSRAES